MKVFAALENVDRRILGAVRFTNAVDGSPVGGALEITAEPLAQGAVPAPNSVFGVRVLRNRFGMHVLQSADGFDDYTDVFLPEPTAPPDGSQHARLRVKDPAGRFLPARFTVDLPRSLRQGGPTPPIASPLLVPLLPAPAAPLADGWCVLRILVWREVSAPTIANPSATLNLPLPGALIVVWPATPEPPGPATVPLGSGLSDWRQRADGTVADAAEALVAVAGVPVTQWNPVGGGPVVSFAQPARLEVRFDPAFDPGAPDALPDVAALRVVGPGVVRTGRTAPLDLRARARLACHLTVTLAHTLQLSALAETSP